MTILSNEKKIELATQIVAAMVSTIHGEDEYNRFADIAYDRNFINGSGRADISRYLASVALNQVNEIESAVAANIKVNNVGKVYVNTSCDLHYLNAYRCDPRLKEVETTELYDDIVDRCFRKCNSLEKTYLESGDIVYSLVKNINSKYLTKFIVK